MIRNVLLLCFAVGLITLGPGAANAVWLGDKAPLFTAESTKGEVKLEDFLGKKYVILAFYFRVNTFA